MKKFITAVLMFTSVASFAANTIHMPSDLSHREKHFIEACSGIKSDNQSTTYALSYAVCFGFIRGLIESHILTIGIVTLDTGTYYKKLWCVDSKRRAEDPINIVFDWIKRNPSMYDDISKEFRGQEHAVATVYKSISQTFPCKEK